MKQLLLNPLSLESHLIGQFTPHLRKYYAAFYTKMSVAKLIALLTVKTGFERVFDPACGFGQLLFAIHQEQLRRFENFEFSPDYMNISEKGQLMAPCDS
ncbi:MAG TPA: N-6 DNA methylase [Candidatus Hodarchaeales archaeon]|nr:N-6 DNA methylase [Candidatus Hodarchaeales archaeon]